MNESQNHRGRKKRIRCPPAISWSSPRKNPPFEHHGTYPPPRVAARSFPHAHQNGLSGRTKTEREILRRPRLPTTQIGKSRACCGYVSEVPGHAGIGSTHVKSGRPACTITPSKNRPIVPATPTSFALGVRPARGTLIAAGRAAPKLVPFPGRPATIACPTNFKQLARGSFSAHRGGKPGGRRHASHAKKKNPKPPKPPLREIVGLRPRPGI